MKGGCNLFVSLYNLVQVSLFILLLGNVFGCRGDSSAPQLAPSIPHGMKNKIELTNKLTSEFAEKKRIDLADGIDRILEMKHVEVYGTLRKKRRKVPIETGAKILQLVSSSPVVKTDDIDDSGEEHLHTLPRFPSFKMSFSYGNRLQLNLSFFDDCTARIFSDGGDEERHDIGGAVEELNELLLELNIQLPISSNEIINAANVSRVEMSCEQDGKQCWRVVGLSEGREIFKTVFESSNLINAESVIFGNDELKNRQFSLKFTVENGPLLCAEIFRDYTWLLVDETTCFQQDTKAQFEEIARLIREGSKNKTK